MGGDQVHDRKRLGEQPQHPRHERLSTKTAKDIMRSNNIKQIEKNEVVDMIAAVVILDNYISSIRKE